MPASSLSDNTSTTGLGRIVSSGPDLRSVLIIFMKDKGIITMRILKFEIHKIYIISLKSIKSLLY